MAARRFPDIRFSVFSDNAFIAADIRHLKEFFTSLAFIFHRLSLNGIFVRGGVAIGSYIESTSTGIEIAPKNFRGYLVSGSAVSVKSSALGFPCSFCTALTSECAEFLRTSGSARLIKLRDHDVILWTEDRDDLADFAAISLFRLAPFLKTLNMEDGPVVETLCANLICTWASSQDPFVALFIIAILSSSLVDHEQRRMICELPEIKLIDLKQLEKEARMVLENDMQRIQMCMLLAEADSSLPYFKKGTSPLGRCNRSQYLPIHGCLIFDMSASWT